MTVGDLDRYLRGLAEAIGKAKGVTDGLVAAANALVPFADMQLPAFASFLRDAKQYKDTGVLPVPTVKGSKAAAPAEPKPLSAAAQTVLAKIRDLHDRAISDPSVTKQAVEEYLTGCKATVPELKAVYQALGYAKPPATKADVQRAIVQHVTQRTGSYQRSDA